MCIDGEGGSGVCCSSSVRRAEETHHVFLCRFGEEEERAGFPRWRIQNLGSGHRVSFPVGSSTPRFDGVQVPCGLTKCHRYNFNVKFVPEGEQSALFCAVQRKNVSR